MTKAIDKYWLFGVRAHQDDPLLNALGHRERRNGSRITPAEGAFMLGVPNIIMVTSETGEPVPFTNDACQYCESFRPLKRVMWSSCGSSGWRNGNEEDFICELSRKYDNICGTYLDDFFARFGAKPQEHTEELLGCIRGIRKTLSHAARPMPIWVTAYMHGMDEVAQSVLDEIDGLVVWTWRSEELPLLPERLQQLEQRCPRHKKLLGIYMFDFTKREAVDMELMKFQCDFGLEMLEAGRVDGLVFEANSVMGVGLPTEAYLREWIARTCDLELTEEH
ncbi:MAG: hypothetical protein IKP00_16950 [Victivallales bacterium]|nr:hypothetical protein [Victivallales bacterium]